MFDKQWLSSMMEMQKKAMDLMKNQTWPFDEDILNKAMELQKHSNFSNSDWYKEILGKMMPHMPNINEMGEFHSAGISQNLFQISEKENMVIVTIHLPGIEKREDLSVRLQGNTLFVTGKNGESDGAIAYSRSIRLPAEVDPRGAAAVYQDNYLSVTIPKANSADNIEIKVEGLPFG